jgi:hypothetical protein
MVSLTPVDYDPFASPAPSTGGRKLTPVGYDPFASSPSLPVASNEAEVRAAEEASGMTPKPMSQWEHFKRGLGMILDDPSLLAQVGPGKAVAAIPGALQAPGDVAAGRVDMASGLPSDMPPETLQRIDDLSTLVNPRALTRQVPRLQPSAPNPNQVAANTAEAAGMTSLPAVAYSGPMVQKFAAGLSDLPIVGAPLVRAADEAREEAGRAVGRLADKTGQAGAEGAGGRIQQGIRDFKKKDIPEIEREVYAPVNAAISPEFRTVPANAIDELAQSRARVEASGGSLGGAVARAQRAFEQHGGQVPFQVLQDVRSAVGQELKTPLKAEGFDENLARRMYAKLTEDLKQGADEAGVRKQWEDANATVAEAQQRVKSVRDLAADNVSPEQASERVFRLAMERSGNAGKMQQLKTTVGDEVWKDVSATAIDRLGRNNAGDFSFNFFVSNYGKMSPGAKNVLFGEANRSVGDLAATFEKLKQLDRFKSKSQSANPTALLGGGAGLGFGASVDPLSTAMTGVALYAGAKWLARPKSAGSMAAWAKAYSSFVKRPTASVKNALMERADATARVIAAESGATGAAEIAALLKGLIEPSQAQAAPLEFNLNQQEAR